MRFLVFFLTMLTLQTSGATEVFDLAQLSDDDLELTAPEAPKNKPKIKSRGASPEIQRRLAAVNTLSADDFKSPDIIREELHEKQYGENQDEIRVGDQESKLEADQESKPVSAKAPEELPIQLSQASGNEAEPPAKKTPDDTPQIIGNSLNYELQFSFTDMTVTEGLSKKDIVKMLLLKVKGLQTCFPRAVPLEKIDLPVKVQMTMNQYDKMESVVIKSTLPHHRQVASCLKAQLQDSKISLGVPRGKVDFELGLRE